MPEPKEFLVPVAVKEIVDASSKRYVVCAPQVTVLIDGVYVDGDEYPLKEPLLVAGGQVGKFEVPSKYTKSSVAGVFAAQLNGHGEPIARAPLGGVIMGDVHPISVKVEGGGVAQPLQFYPQNKLGRAVPVRFKRFELSVVEGEEEFLYVMEVLIGSNVRATFGPSYGPIPFKMAMKDGAFMVPFLIAPGIAFQVFIANRGPDPVEIGGGIVFEDVPEARSSMPNHAIEREN